VRTTLNRSHLRWPGGWIHVAEVSGSLRVMSFPGMRRCVASLSEQGLVIASIWSRRQLIVPLSETTNMSLVLTPSADRVRSAVVYWSAGQGTLYAPLDFEFVAKLRSNWIAERRTTRSIRTASTIPSPLLGVPAWRPASTARAADTASSVSDLPSKWRAVRSGRFTSTTATPLRCR